MRIHRLCAATLGGAFFLLLGASGLRADEAAAAPAPPNAEAATPDLAEGDAKLAADRREALRLLQQAESELREGSSAKAFSVAKQAQALYPESRSIAGLIREIRSEREASTTLSAQLRAKARLAAALTRARQLLDQRRYAEAADLLDGVRDAAELFPEGTRVALFRQQAERFADSARYAMEIRSMGSYEAPPAAAEESVAPEESATVRPRPVAPPRNYTRLTVPEGPVPQWYSQLKASLAVPMNVEYPGMPLGHVLDEIQKATGVKIFVDEAVRRAGTPINALIDLRINGASAETILSLVTELSGTEYVLLPDRVVITTPDKALRYVSELPSVLADRWIGVRILFPDQFAAQLAPSEGVTLRAREAEAIELPPYLRSGEALVGEVKRLLR